MFEHLHHQIKHAEERVRITMSKLQDLDLAIENLANSIDQLIAKLNTAGAPPPPPVPAEDFSNETDALAGIQSKVDAVLNPPAPSTDNSGSGDNSGAATVVVQ